MVLNRNPDNFFAETEQVAFCTAHVVPGIDFSNDPLLAGRIHSYLDTQITRLGGPNFHEIPINAPLAPVHNNQRDGMHRQAIPRGRVAYEPNSLGGGCPFQAGAAGFVSFPQTVEGDKLRGKPEKFADHYTQATLFYESQTAVEKAHIVGGFRFELSKLTVPAIRERMLASLVNVSADMAAKIADGLPDGSDGVALLAGYGQTREFVANQYRHGKTILALGAAKALLDQADVAATLPSGEPDPGILLVGIAAPGDSAAAFIAAVARHRHPSREMDPPRI
jgi:hypothetical protein